MSLNQREDGTPVHFPANPDKFQFDEQVAQIFPNMAARSIPNYEYFHRLHAQVVASRFLRAGATILDVGASRGEFFHAIHRFHKSIGIKKPPVAYVAIDNSQAMCDLLINDLSIYKDDDIHVICQNIDSPEFLQSDCKYDVINCTYVLQFIRPELQLTVLRKLADMVNPGGVLILGQKDASPGILGAMLHDEYIRFRMEHGYTRAEIEAKTAALKNAMWPMLFEDMVSDLYFSGFKEVVETTRAMMFSTVMCLK